LGAWIEHESDGRSGVTTSLGEVGYFQLHPAEIEDMAGADKVASVVAAIEGSPQQNVRWGGRLLKHYDSAVVRFGVARGTPLYHALLKVMHSSRPRGIRWMQHVVAVMGRPPNTYDEFLQIVNGLRSGKIPRRISKSLPARAPSCAPGYLLERRNTFLLPGEDPRYPTGRLGGVTALYQGMQQAYSAGAAAVLSTLGGAWSELSMPVPAVYALVSSGWGDDRSYRGGLHEGIDIHAPKGTPVFSIADGVVTAVRTGAHAGLYVAVKHAGGLTSRYMHLDSRTVAKGDHVSGGDKLGTVGTSGTSGSGPHLHLSLSLASEYLVQYIKAFGKPTRGFGTVRSIGVSVPAEPLVPVRAYTARVAKAAKARGVTLYLPQAPVWPKVVIGMGVVALVGLVGLDLYRRRA
jgi:hypothetical protein